MRDLNKLEDKLYSGVTRQVEIKERGGGKHEVMNHRKMYEKKLKNTIFYLIIFLTHFERY